MTHYPRAPITEAVIDLRFQEPIAKEVVDKAQARLAETYPLRDPWVNRMVVFDAASLQGTVQQEAVGYRMSSLDVSELCIISTHNFTLSKLAPYTRWEDLYGRATRDWNEWKRAVGYRRIQRIGVRYINRIDIPCEPGQRVTVEEYLLCYPAVPERPGFPTLSNYAMQLTMVMREQGWAVVINTATVPPPVLNHVSFVLDIDLSREGDLPQKDEELWALIAEARDHKNNVFESCITDRSRALFSQ